MNEIKTTMADGESALTKAMANVEEEIARETEEIVKRTGAKMVPLGSAFAPPQAAVVPPPPVRLPEPQKAAPAARQPQARGSSLDLLTQAIDKLIGAQSSLASLSEHITGEYLEWYEPDQHESVSVATRIADAAHVIRSVATDIDNRIKAIREAL